MNNSLVEEVLKTFRQRFVPRGHVLWMSAGEERGPAVRSRLTEFGISNAWWHDLPNVVISDKERERIVLIDVAELRGLIDKKRQEGLKRIFGECGLDLRFVNAFRNRLQFQKYFAFPAWQTAIWFADEPIHLVYFDGSSLLDPTRS